jgi:hypothetical protein
MLIDRFTTLCVGEWMKDNDLQLLLSSPLRAINTALGFLIHELDGRRHELLDCSLIPPPLLLTGWLVPPATHTQWKLFQTPG